MVDTATMFDDIQDAALMVKFFPDLLSVMVDSTLHGILRQLKEDHTHCATPTSFTQLISRHGTAMHVACGYALELLEKKDIRAFSLLLPSIAEAFVKSDSINLPDIFLHLLVLKMASMRQLLKESTFLVVLRDFWVPCSQSSEHVLLYLFRMLWFLHASVSDTLLREVLETVEPGKEVTIGVHAVLRPHVCVAVKQSGCPSMSVCGLKFNICFFNGVYRCYYTAS